MSGYSDIYLENDNSAMEKIILLEMKMLQLMHIRRSNISKIVIMLLNQKLISHTKVV